MTNMDKKLIDYITANQKVQDSTGQLLDKMNDVINSQSQKIRDQNRNINFMMYIQIATLIVLGLVHSVHSGWFDNIGWFQ